MPSFSAAPPSPAGSAAAPAGFRRGRAAPARTQGSLYGLDLGAMWSAFRGTSPAFWFTSLYIFFEYVRPQSIYTWLDVLPWSFLALMGATLFTVLEQRMSFKAVGLWALVALFTAVLVGSGLTAQFPSESWRLKDVWINWLLLMFVVGAGVRNRTEMLLLLVGFTLWNIKMSQHGVRSWAMAGFSFRSWGATGAPGWFQNSGEFGIEMCIFGPLVGYMAYGLWPNLSKWKRAFVAAVVASAVISIVASSSRGALIGAAAIGIWMVLRSPNRLRAILIVAVLSSIVWLTLPAESKLRFTEMGDDKTSQSRLEYWEHAIEIGNQFPLLGIGYKNWLPFYRTYYNPKGELPHNFMMEALAELGYAGALLLTLLLVTYFITNAQTRRLTSPTAQHPDRLLHSVAFGLDGAMIGFMVSGSFVSVLYYPFIWMNLAFCMALYRVAADLRGGRARTASPRVAARRQVRALTGASG